METIDQLEDATVNLQETRAVRTPGRHKPRVLILPNVASWIVGQMATQIIERFKDKYDFWILTEKVIRLRPDLVKALIPEMDFIFPLADKTFTLLRAAAGSVPLPPAIFWLHHITSWNPSILAAAKEASELIACTPEWKSAIEDKCPEASVTVVRHGVDAQFFRKVERQRARFGMRRDGFVIGVVGNKTSNFDHGRKGLDTLELVLRKVRDHVPNLHVCFLGLGWDAEVRQFQQQGISANYTGFVPHSWLPAFYSSIDVHLVTARVEGGPVTVMEAMACETPVVATRVGLVPHTIADGENGFSAAIGDVEALAQALRNLWASAALRRSIGSAARMTVSPSMSWHRVLDALEEPLARMETRSDRAVTSSFTSNAKTAAQLAGAVHTMDGLLWGIMSWWDGLLTAPVAGRLVKACWEGHGASDVLRGIGLATRTSFRPAVMQRKRVA